jgi:hypothetical protein
LPSGAGFAILILTTKPTPKGVHQMTLKELAKTLGADEAQVSELLASRNIDIETVTPSMFSSLGAGLHGGQLAATQTGITAPAKLKAQAQAGKLATKKPIGKIVKAEPVQTVKGQTVELMDATSAHQADELTADTAQLAQLLNPELRAMQIVSQAQTLSAAITESLNGQGITVDSIVAAALPRAQKRLSISELMDQAVAKIDVDAMITNVFEGVS